MRKFGYIIGITIVFYGLGGQAKSFPGGTGRPTNADPMVNRSPHPRPLGRLNLDVLFQKLRFSRIFQTASGGMSDEERRYFNQNQNNTTSPEYLARKKEVLARFLSSYTVDYNKAGQDTPSIEIMADLKKQGMDVSLDAVKAAQPELDAMTPKSGQAVVAEMRATKLAAKPPALVAKVRGWLMGSTSKGGLFALADVFMLGKGVIQSKSDVEEDVDIEKRVCRKDPSDSYVQKVTLLDAKVQREILSNCNPAERQQDNSLEVRIGKKRDESKRKFSGLKAICKFDERGFGVIEYVGYKGTKQRLLFDKEDKFEKLQITADFGAYSGSFIEYSGSAPNEQVSYSLIRNSNGRSAKPDFHKPQIKNEKILAFGARVQCSCCTCDDQIFSHIPTGDAPLYVSQDKPFGNLQDNADFAERAGTMLGHFRIGFQQDDWTPLTFSHVCQGLGSSPPKRTSAPASEAVDVTADNPEDSRQ